MDKLPDEFLGVAEEVVKRFLALPENPKSENTGCYIYVANREDLRPLLLIQVGICDLESANRSFMRVQEKVNRTLHAKHISSWGSRDVVSGKEGGAIVVPSNARAIDPGGDGCAIGVDGFSEEGNEAIALIIALRFELISWNNVGRIIAISGNTLFKPLVRACADMIGGSVKA